MQASMLDSIVHHEKEARALQEDSFRENAFQKYAGERVAIVPRFLAWMLFFIGDLCYGSAPSYKKFRAIEMIARIPYQTWEMYAYMVQTAYFSNETRAIALAEHSAFSRLAQDNETMHVVVISQLFQEAGERKGKLHTVWIPLFLSVSYFFACSVLHILNKRWTYELNFLFETHAFLHYGEFLVQNEGALKSKSVHSNFLSFYGRHVENQYEFFSLVRNDELLHRNHSIELAKLCK